MTTGLELKKWVEISAADMERLRDDLDHGRKLWREVTVDDVDKGRRIFKAKLLEADYLVIKWGGGHETHYLLTADGAAVAESIAREVRRETVERHAKFGLQRVYRYC